MRPRSANSESAAEDLYALHHTRYNMSLQLSRYRGRLLDVIPYPCQQVGLFKGMLHIGLEML